MHGSEERVTLSLQLYEREISPATDSHPQCQPKWIPLRGALIFSLYFVLFQHRYI